MPYRASSAELAKPAQPVLDVRPQECHLERHWFLRLLSHGRSLPCSRSPVRAAGERGPRGSSCQAQIGLQSESESELEFSSSVLWVVASFPESPCLRNLATSLKIR